jgi:hypothetical protein
MRGVLLACAATAVIIALLFARPHPTPGPPMRDFEAYYAAGTTWNAGEDAYSQAIWPQEQRLSGVDAHRYEALPFVSPPALLPLFGAIARLPFDAANVLWRTLLIFALAALALLTLRLARLALTLESFVAIAVAALGFGPLTSALALGQIALPAFLFAVLAVVWRPAALLAWMQPNVALTLAPLLFSRRALSFIVPGAVFAGACVLVAGMGGTARYAGVLHAHGNAEQLSAIQITPAAIAYGFGAAPHLAAAIGIIVAVGAAACWLLLIRAAADMPARFCATCALLPLAMPFFHEHDLLVLFVPAIAFTVRAGARVWPPAALGALFAATDWLGLAQRPDGTLQTLLLIGALGAALIALRERPQARMLVVPGIVLAAIGAAALFASAHPAPVWPDAMHQLPATASANDISSAWNQEQRATGLFAANFVWAALRLCSLLGCVLTACAIALSLKSPERSKSPSPAPA